MVGPCASAALSHACIACLPLMAPPALMYLTMVSQQPAPVSRQVGERGRMRLKGTSPAHLAPECSRIASGAPQTWRGSAQSRPYAVIRDQRWCSLLFNANASSASVIRRINQFRSDSSLFILKTISCPGTRRASGQQRAACETSLSGAFCQRFQAAYCGVVAPEGKSAAHMANGPKLLCISPAAGVVAIWFHRRCAFRQRGQAA